MLELILVRHGETDWNRELRFQGQIDVGLNATGREQARRLADRLVQEGLSSELVSSDLMRARQTAEPAARRLHTPVQADAALREQAFGVIDGLSVPEIQARHPDIWPRWKAFDPDYAPPGGESLRQFHARVIAALQALRDRHAGRTLVVVTHGGVLDMVWRTATGQSLQGPRTCAIPNAGLNRVRIGAQGPEILSWAEVEHLIDLPQQPIYDQSRLSRPSAE